MKAEREVKNNISCIPWSRNDLSGLLKGSERRKKGMSGRCHRTSVQTAVTFRTTTSSFPFFHSGLTLSSQCSAESGEVRKPLQIFTCTLIPAVHSESWREVCDVSSLWVLPSQHRCWRHNLRCLILPIIFGWTIALRNRFLFVRNLLHFLEMTWRLVNDDISFICGWTTPPMLLSEEHFPSIPTKMSFCYIIWTFYWYKSCFQCCFSDRDTCGDIRNDEPRLILFWKSYSDLVLQLNYTLTKLLYCNTC